MKVTKYPQSCLLLEKGGHRIVIDPGVFFTAKYGRQELGKVEAVLYTHQHPDHYDPALAKVLQAEGVPLYGNESVCKLIEAGCQLSSDGGFGIAGFEIIPHDLAHCVMADGSAGPQNTGYIVDGTLFHPGDGIEAQGLKVDNIALPIAGPSISLHEAFKFALSVGAKKIIPVHYDNVGLFPGNPNGFAKVFDKAEVIVLADGESTEL